MGEYLWPTTIVPRTSEIRLRDLSARFTSPITGTQRTYSRPGGQLLRLALELPTLTATQKAAWRAFLAGLRGGVHRVWCKDHSYVRRGSFPAGELLANNTFADLGGWSAGTNTALLAADRALVIRATGNDATSGLLAYRGTGTLTAYIPVVGRMMLEDGSRPWDAMGIYLDDDGAVRYANNYGTTGLRVATLVPTNDGAGAFAVSLSELAGEFMAGDWLRCSWTSLARCALVDNAPNAAKQAAVFGNASWVKTGGSITTNTGMSPDGATTAETFSEDGATSEHSMSQAVTVNAATTLDYTATFDVKANGRTWCAVGMVEGTASGLVYQYVNLSNGNTGASGTGTNWAERRVTVTSLGNGWYRIALTARKTSASTTVTPILYAATASGTNSYAGSSAAALYVVNGGLAAVSHPFSPGNTVSTAAPTGTVQAGAGLRLRGLPASTNGLLLPGDQVQVGTELLIVTSSLDSDAGGGGYVGLHRPPRTAPADGAPVIIHEPMGRFLLEESEAGWANRPGGFAESSVTLIEDVA